MIPKYITFAKLMKIFGCKKDMAYYIIKEERIATYTFRRLKDRIRYLESEVKEVHNKRKNTPILKEAK